MTANLTEAFYARLHAFHAPTLEFYRKDQLRDAHGRWTRGRKAATGPGKQSAPLTPTKNKSWSGVSAHPTDRVKPTPSPDLKNAFRIENDWRSNEALGHRIYDADLGGGYHSAVVEVEPAGDYRNPVMSVRGVLMKGTKEIGTFERTVGQDENGIVVSHDELMINPSQQSKGVGDRFNAHAIAEYQRLGVDRIILHAGDTVGGYAWARQGFRFDEGEGNEYRLKFLDHVLTKAEGAIKHIPAVREHQHVLMKQVAALRKAIAAGEDVQPIHIASLGEQHKWQVYDDHHNLYDTWAGKQALLGSRWNGVYYFDTAHPVTASAMSLEHADLRTQFRLDAAVKTSLCGHGLISFACHDASCRPPTSGGTGGSRPNHSVTIVGGTMKERKPLIKELNAQGLDKLNPLRHIFQSWMGNRLAVVRNDKGEIVGGVQFDVDKGLTQITVRDMRMLERRSGHGTSAFVEMAKIAKDLDYDFQVTNSVSEAKPFYSKLGAHFRADHNTGTFTDETRDALAAGKPKSGKVDMTWDDWSALPMWTAAARHAAKPRRGKSIQAAASAHFGLCEHGSITAACHDASCRPPTSGGTGGSKPSNKLIKWGASEQDPEIIKHEGSLRIAAAMTNAQRYGLEDALDFRVANGSPLWEINEYAIGQPLSMTCGVAAQLASVNLWSQMSPENSRITDQVYKLIDEHDERIDSGGNIAESLAQFSESVKTLTGISQASGFVSYINQAWAHSSMSQESVMMQITAATARSLPDAMDALKRATVNEGMIRYVQPEMEKLRKALHAVFEATYDVTQETLAEHGVTEITLYRGVQASRIGGSQTIDTIIAQPSPLSSWSSDHGVAERFGNGGAVYEAKIPASQVYSVAAHTGNGSWEEREFVVIGMPVTATKVGNMSEELAAGAPVVYIDEEDFDWIKKVGGKVWTTSTHHSGSQDFSSSPVAVCLASILPNQTMTTLVRSWSQRPTESD